jgi:hypothetical protein
LDFFQIVVQVRVDEATDDVAQGPAAIAFLKRKYIRDGRSEVLDTQLLVEKDNGNLRAID